MQSPQAPPAKSAGRRSGAGANVPAVARRLLVASACHLPLLVMASACRVLLLVAAAAYCALLLVVAAYRVLPLVAVIVQRVPRCARLFVLPLSPYFRTPLLAQVVHTVN